MRQLLRRTGVVFPQDDPPREAAPPLARPRRAGCGGSEARGVVRGGRFVAGFIGEQYALPEAVSLLRGRPAARASRHAPLLPRPPIPLSACAASLLTPDERVSPPRPRPSARRLTACYFHGGQ